MPEVKKNVALTLLPSNRLLDVPEGKRLADVIRAADMPLGFSCGGRGVCVACVVHTRGEFSAMTVRERDLLNMVEPAPEGWCARIACLTRIQSDGAVQTTYW